MNIRTTRKSSSLLDTWSTYTSQNLREIADEMEAKGILFLDLEMGFADYSDDQTFRCYACYAETEAERIAREAIEKAAQEQRLKWEREQFEQLKKKFES
jgi:hypothetical protein